MVRIPLVFVTVFGTLFSVPLPASSEDISVGQLLTRDARVTLLSSASGLRFTVHSVEGKLLATRLGEAQLAREHPNIYELIRSSIASPTGAADTLRWAGCTACDGLSRAPTD